MTTYTACQIMSRSEPTLSPDLDIYDALDLLIGRALTGAAVVDDAGHLLGMLTEKDCLKIVVAGALDGIPSGRVKDHMTSPAESVPMTATLYTIVHLFLTRTFRKLPVVDRDGRVMGQVSRRDVLRFIRSIRQNTRLYGARPPLSFENPGVDSAMLFARSAESRPRRFFG